MSPAVDVSVVVPTRDRAHRLDALWTATSAVLDARGDRCELILVDDGSTDATWATICGLAGSDPRVRGVRLARNVGQAGALCAGFSVADGTVLVTMDDDLEIDPVGIDLLVEAIHRGAGLASGQRTARGGPSLRQAASMLYNARLRLRGFPLHDAGCGFNATDAEVGRRFSQLGWDGRMHRCKPMAVALTDRIVEVPLPPGRPNPRSNFHARDLAMSWLDVELALGPLTRSAYVGAAIVGPLATGALLVRHLDRRSRTSKAAHLGAACLLVALAALAADTLWRREQLEARARREPPFEIVETVGAGGSVPAGQASPAVGQP
jgi:glycosyltransferase involved in cell wall biosynthesis